MKQAEVVKRIEYYEGTSNKIRVVDKIGGSSLIIAASSTYFVKASYRKLKAKC